MHGKTVVHGHTPRARPVAGRWRIGIDTEAYDSGALTAGRFEDDHATFLKVQVTPGKEGTRISEWEAIDKSHDRPEQTGPAPGSKRTRAVSRGGLMAAGAVALATIMVVGILVGLVVWSNGRGGSDSTPVRPTAASARPVSAIAAASAPLGTAPQPSAVSGATAPPPPVPPKPVTLAAKAPSGSSTAETAPSHAPTSSDVTAKSVPPPSPAPTISATTAAADTPIRTAPETAPAAAPAAPPGPAN